jgi:hypothetical protein
MNFDKVGEVNLPKSEKLQIVTNLNSEPSSLLDGKIIVHEMKIDGELNPDIALIHASTDTPIQRYEGDGEVTEVFFKTTNDKPIGIILMSPTGEMVLQVYNPKTDGGQRGFTITKGWTMQEVIPDGTTLTFLEYWTPIGFSSPDENGKMHGENVLVEEGDSEILEKFANARLELLEYLLAGSQ